MKKILMPLWLLVIVAAVSLGWLIFRDISMFVQLRSYLGFVRAQSEASVIPSFADWPLEKQLANATVVARADRRLVNGVQQAVISEVLKVKPGTEFKYKIGDHFAPADQRAQRDTEYGEGVLLMFTGQHATLQFMVAIYDGQLATGNEVSLADIRKLLESTAKGLNN